MKFVNVIDKIIFSFKNYFKKWNKAIEIYKKARMLKREFYEHPFLFQDIPSEFNISVDDLEIMRVSKLCRALPFTNLRNKYQMIVDNIH
jgi:hypothetical protein